MKTNLSSSLFCLLLLLGWFFVGYAHRILGALTAGDSFGRNSHQTKYKIEFHSLESPFQSDADQESLVMSYQNGTRYKCFLPRAENKKSVHSVAQHNGSTLVMEADRHTNIKTPDELLDMLKGQCLLRQEGWWTYELCYHKRFRQLHMADNKVVQEFVLGTYDAEATATLNQNNSDTSTLKDPRSIDGAHRYRPHLYTNGTICDLTNQPRETEVRFVCIDSLQVLITSIKEISTCRYAVTVQFPMLCKHPMFKEEKPVWHTINCNEFPPDNQNAGEQVENAEQPDPLKIREEDIVGVTVLLPACSCLGQEFVRVGYYVNNDYDDEQLKEEPPQKVLIDRIQRNILTGKPRVTKFPINFHPDANQSAEAGPAPDPPAEENVEQPASFRFLVKIYNFPV